MHTLRLYRIHSHTSADLDGGTQQRVVRAADVDVVVQGGEEAPRVLRVRRDDPIRVLLFIPAT